MNKGKPLIQVFAEEKDMQEIESKQSPHIKLHEIIWEITGECKNGCKYCGSKSEWKIKTPNDKIIQIAKKIALYPPVEIDISGGDPTLVDIKTLREVYSILKKSGVIYVKILCNPKSFSRKDAFEKIDMFDWIGVSINTKEELELFNQSLYEEEYDIGTTIITNFNLENVFMFDEIYDRAKRSNCKWQIQYTTYQEEDNPLAIYNNENALKYLFDKITETGEVGSRILIADDMNNGPCGAGKVSCGILSNGDVVGCLSMRSWQNELTPMGNVLETLLEDIWKNEFKEYRFCSFKCCKDHCGNKPYIPTKTMPIKTLKTPINIIDLGKEPYNPTKPNVYMYAVLPDYNQPVTTMYAVSLGNDESSELNNGEGFDDNGDSESKTDSTDSTDSIEGTEDTQYYKYGVFADKPKTPKTPKTPKKQNPNTYIRYGLGMK